MCRNPMNRIKGRIVCNKTIADGIYEMIVEAKAIASIARPGQFVNLYTKDASMLLPRPISLCEVDQEEGRLRLVYAKVGKGTSYFASMKEGESIELLGPLGHGFDMEAMGQQILLVGGGVGTPPMLELAKRLKEQDNKRELSIVVGFRSQSYLVEDLKKYGTVHVATDDGSQGYKGNVVELIQQTQMIEEYGIKQFYACGPKPMLKSLQGLASRKELVGQLSLEERMGCGFGGCVGCVVALEADNDEGFIYKKVCKDGPVFDYKEVKFQ